MEFLDFGAQVRPVAEHEFGASGGDDGVEHAGGGHAGGGGGFPQPHDEVLFPVAHGAEPQVDAHPYGTGERGDGQDGGEHAGADDAHAHQGGIEQVFGFLFDAVTRYVGRRQGGNSCGENLTDGFGLVGEQGIGGFRYGRHHVGHGLLHEGLEFGFDLAGEHLWFGAQHPELLPVDLVLPVLFDFVEVFIERVGDFVAGHREIALESLFEF